MNRLRWLAVLMGVAILGITGFQLYWLRQNYLREKKSLGIKTDMAFRETIMQLQVAKLKLDGVQWNGKMVMHGMDGEEVSLRISPKEKIVSTINVISSKLKDSLKIKTGVKSGLVVNMDKKALHVQRDSVRFERLVDGPPGKPDHIFNLLYGVDSLQDSLRLSEIDSAYTIALQQQKLNIPFLIIKKDSASHSADHSFNEVSVGLAHPVSYSLQLGNTFPYLARQIMQPVLFSILLLGITILSFVLLYRTLLRQQRLAALKNEFISNITHELKTPVATVGVAIEALRSFNAMQDPARTKEYLDISASELQRLNLLVDKVLKLSMFEKKEMELKMEQVDLKEVVDEVLGSLKLQLEKHQAQVSVSIKGSMLLPGDRLHLLSVVFNLVDNAVKYSKAAPVINIELKEKENTVVLRVSDNGIGIAPEYQHKIFEKFFRIPHGDTHNAKGYGLGLSYAAQVVAKHKGTIVVDSQPGTGTTFTITLPKQTT